MGRSGQSLIKALSYSTCLADAVTGAAQRGFVQSVFRAAANITFPGDFILSLNALDIPRLPNSLQLSAPGDTLPFSTLRVGMPVLLGAQRLHIEAIALSLDLTYCTQWHPKIVRPQQLHLAIIEKNSAWLTRYVANLAERPPYSHQEHHRPDPLSERPTRPDPGYPQGVPLPWTTELTSMVGVPLAGTLAAGTGMWAGMGTWAGMVTWMAVASVHDMAQQLCGRGLGLTPTGDDILAGWMAANWLLHGAHPRLLEAYQDILAVAKRQTHLLSQCWLRYAAEGYVAEPIGLLLQALTRENEMELALATETVLALGATSGRDVIHGILLGLAGLQEW